MKEGLAVPAVHGVVGVLLVPILPGVGGGLPVPVVPHEHVSPLKSQQLLYIQLLIFKPFWYCFLPERNYVFSSLGNNIFDVVRGFLFLCPL